jgi:hypothetical protein
MELFKQIQERRIEDVRQSIKDHRDAMEREQREWATESLAIREEIIKQKLEAQKKIERLEESLNREIAIVDTLLGDDPAAKEAIRAVALLLATNPAASAAIKAAAEKEIKQ